MTTDRPAPRNVEQLEDRLSEPTEGVVQTMKQLQGDLLILGVGGKMGPTLARMARRAETLAGGGRRIIGVSRFSSPGLREQLERDGVETIACDLLDEDQVRRLPDAANVVFMAGFKFGSQAAPSRTWAVNCHVPALVAAKFRSSRIVAFSTGNVYSFVPYESGGSQEDDALQPIGEYAMTALGRERMFEYFAERYGFPLAILRLNYAAELRYGVLLDLATQVQQGQPVNLSMGYVNVIWQGSANAAALRSLNLVGKPPRVFNLAGPEILRVRDVCQRFGELLERRPKFEGAERPDALLSNGSRLQEIVGPPSVTANQLIEWTAQWLQAGGTRLGKPTHFEARDGQF